MKTDKYFFLILCILGMLMGGVRGATSLFDTISSRAISNSASITTSNINLTIYLPESMGGTGTNSFSAALAALGAGGNVFSASNNVFIGLNTFSNRVSLGGGSITNALLISGATNGMTLTVPTLTGGGLTAGDLNLSAGSTISPSSTSVSGSINLTAGAGQSGSPPFGTGGSITLQAGGSAGSPSTGGSINILAGGGALGTVAGNVNISAGATASGTPGTIVLKTGSSLVQRLLISSVGTATFSNALVVAGNSTLGGATNTFNGLRFPTADGTASQIIKTDGAGVLSFTTLASADIFSASNNTFTGSNTFSNRVTIAQSVSGITNVFGGTGTNYWEISGPSTATAFGPVLTFRHAGTIRAQIGARQNDLGGVYICGGDDATTSLAALQIGGSQAKLQSVAAGYGFFLDPGTGITFQNGGPVSVTGDLTIGDSSADAITINAATAAIPNGINFGSSKFSINNDGSISQGVTNTAQPANAYIRNITSAAYTVLQVKGTGSQTGDLQQWLTSAGVTNASIKSDGQPTWFVNPGYSITKVASPSGNIMAGLTFQTTGTGAAGMVFIPSIDIGTDNSGIELMSRYGGAFHPILLNTNGVTEINKEGGSVQIGAPVTVSNSMNMVSNSTSRGFGIAVSTVNSVTNTLIQPFSGTYPGLTTNFTFGTTFAAAPTVVITTTTANGTTLLNDTVWVTNVTTTGYTIGYRTAGGIDSTATLTFNGIAVGRQ